MTCIHKEYTYIDTAQLCTIQKKTSTMKNPLITILVTLGILACTVSCQPQSSEEEILQEEKSLLQENKYALYGYYVGKGQPKLANDLFLVAGALSLKHAEPKANWTAFKLELAESGNLHLLQDAQQDGLYLHFEEK